MNEEKTISLMNKDELKRLVYELTENNEDELKTASKLSMLRAKFRKLEWDFDDIKKENQNLIIQNESRLETINVLKEIIIKLKGGEKNENN